MEFARAPYVLVISSLLLFIISDTVTGEILYKPVVVNTNDDACRENEVYSRCQADQLCEKSCDNIDIWESVPCVKSKNCLSGCICKEGYVRERKEGVCVLENSCPRVRH